MLESLKQFIRDNNLFTTNDKLLLTVSGGIDSMVMLHLINQLGISFGVAHCNFQLRGTESDEDAQFVKTSVGILNAPFFLAKFETQAYAEENHLSIQMAARELRYTWFENIRKTHGYTCIATAHNADDSIETFFINLSRGCGIDGLTGIKPKTGNLIRPLLFASREIITHYAKRKGVIYREDSSNATDKYLRNYIRHNILPSLDEASSNFRNGIQTTIQNLVSNQTIYDYFIEKTRTELVSKINDAYCIDIEKLKKLPHTEGIVWELLNPFNFNRNICFDVANSLDSQPGKIFLSPTHRLIKDRAALIITRLQNRDNQIYYIEPENVPSGTPCNLKLSVEERGPDTLFSRNPEVAMLDFNLMEWPLILRKWQPGDYFAPLGMENLKKVSDFLIDLKLSIYEKENTWVLESGNRIAWIVGRRIDHRFRIKETTRKILRIQTSSSTELRKSKGKFTSFIFFTFNPNFAFVFSNKLGTEQ